MSGEEDKVLLEHDQDDKALLVGPQDLLDHDDVPAIPDHDDVPASPEQVPHAFPLEHGQNDDVRRYEAIIATTLPTTELEVALAAMLTRKNAAISKLNTECEKLKQFVAKRKQTYKRKRKDDGAPVRALSGYNLFIKERFAELKKENEKALKSQDVNDQMRRVPPSNLVAQTGNEWKALAPELKAKYDERAKADRKRYEEQMAQYNPPDKNSGRKRGKSGYNMFFSAHVLRLKQTDTGVPSERGSVARLVGEAWKSLSPEEKSYYEREADKHNGMNPMKDEEEEEEGDDHAKLAQMEHHQYPYAPHEMPHHPAMHPIPHDPRAYHQYYPPYDYSQHHQRHSQRYQYHF
mmetsp:Transcript_27892/g.76768  ORF Transcript_27892/g.76768 Transcript_27892/m.76768 type:complete len:348 (+) Transcript_27892:123-1166(+)